MAQSFQYDNDRQALWLGLNPFSYLNTRKYVFDTIRLFGSAA